jgi:DNA-binding HxlR family transcriptional regulator
MAIKQEDNEHAKCPVETAIDTISGKWKAMILIHLMTEMHRFNELKKMLPNISQRMLANQLRDLESDGLVHREVYPEVPPRVEYSLTKRGLSVRKVLDELRHFGKKIQGL